MKETCIDSFSYSNSIKYDMRNKVLSKKTKQTANYFTKAFQTVAK
jgi:hypothetical protein